MAVGCAGAGLAGLLYYRHQYLAGRAHGANADDKDEPVMYTFELDPRDKCMHVNYLETQEKEFLFAPYSAFQVISADWQAQPTRDKPHTITLAVASDNRDEQSWPLALPLAPWA